MSTGTGPIITRRTARAITFKDQATGQIASYSAGTLVATRREFRSGLVRIRVAGTLYCQTVTRDSVTSHAAACPCGAVCASTN